MKIKSKVLCYILIFLLLLCAIPALKVVNASDEPRKEQPALHYEISESEILDERLYYSLTAVYNMYYDLPVVENDVCIVPRLTKLYKNMFEGMDFAYFNNTLNLNGNSRVSNGIKNLMGLNLIDFTNAKNLEKVDLSYNEISSVLSSQIKSLSMVKEIDLSNNNIISISLTDFSNIEKLDLSFNSLTSVNLSNINTTNTDGVIDLSSNKITNLEDITLRRDIELQNELNIYLLNNYITNTETDRIKVKYNFGLLGLKSNKRYGTDQDLIYKKINNVDNISTAQDVKLYAKDYNNLQQISGFEIINSSLSEDINIIDLLGIGKYILYYVDQDGNSIDNINFKDAVNPYIIEIVPSMPIATLDSEVLKNGDSQLIKEDKIITLSSSDAEVVFYYKLNDSDWIEGNEIPIKANTTGFIKYKSVKNGIESEVSQINLEKNTNLGDHLITILLIVAGLVLLFVVIMPLARYYANKPVVINKKNRNDKV